MRTRSGCASSRTHAELTARWTNVARELVDGPPNFVTPASLAERAAALPGVSVEVIDPVAAGLTALAAVGGSSAQAPKLLVLRNEPAGAPERPLLAFVGKAVTFDAGGYFLKPQSDIVRQKGDMAAGAAVLAALGAIAELELPVNVIGVIPACENMIGPDAIRPSDVIRTASGLTVEVTNPDAEGRLILADALWFARSQGATHLIDLATLTGAMRAGMGDLYGGVFSNDKTWLDAVVDAGNASGDLAWPWPLHPRYKRLLESRVADLRNTSGRPYGYPITAATSSSTSPATAPGRTSTCSGRRCSTTIAATRSARARAATACACSSSSARAWPPRCGAARRRRRSKPAPGRCGRSGASRRTTTTRSRARGQSVKKR